LDCNGPRVFSFVEFNMKPQDWFGLGVRFAGVWCMIQTVTNVVFFLDVRLASRN